MLKSPMLKLPTPMLPVPELPVPKPRSRVASLICARSRSGWWCTARSPALLLLAVTALALAACDHRGTPGAAAPTADSVPAPAAAAPSLPDEAAASPAQFRASGNEPFWAVQVDGDTLTWTTPEMQPGRRLSVEQATDASGVRFFGKDGAVDFSFEVTPGECQDSMSGKMFDYSAAFIHGDEKMTGCARAGLGRD